MKLLLGGTRRLGFQRDRHDRMFGAKIFQMGLEKAKEQIDGGGRIGDLEPMLVFRLVGKPQTKSQLLSNEIECAEAPGQLLEKTPQDKKKRLGSFDFVLELDLLEKNFRRPHKSQETGRFPARLFPKPGRFRPEPGGKLILTQSGKCAEGVHPPFVENGEEPRNFR